MTRRPHAKAEDFQWFEEITVEAIKHTTIEERKAVALEWSRGNREDYKTFAATRNIQPAGLITAALIDAEHPNLVHEGRALFKSIMEAQLMIVEAEIKGTWVVNFVHSPLVDGLWTRAVQVPKMGEQSTK